jgi:hypothetical protein
MSSLFLENEMMSNRPARWLLTLGACIGAGAAAADEIVGTDRFVCTAWQAISCSTEGNCKPTEAWRLNMPDFLKVDLRAKELITPEGTDEPRASAIETVTRRDGRVFLSGSQQARGYTWVINEETGEGTLAIVSDTTVITLFTACASSDRLR